MNGVVSPNTLKFTYYSPASGCSLYGGSPTSANCWMVQVMSVNNIPLSSKSVHLIYTNSSTSQTCFFGMPTSISNGMVIYVKDANGCASTNNIMLQSTSSNNIDGSSNATINSNYGKMTTVYAGSGSSGEWFTL